MCSPTSHALVWTSSLAQPGIPVGHVCLCGRLRWGTEDELRALDEVARLEAMLAVPWHERTRWP